MIKNFLITVLFVLSFNGYIFAHTGGMVTYTCPLDNNTFEQFTDFSGTSFDSRLDFKSIGPIADPWAIPKCTKCGFVIYKKNDKFTADEIADLKKYIFSEEYKKLKDDNSTYYCLAKIMEYRKNNDRSIAWAYLQASWQVEPDDQKKYREYTLLSLQYFDKISKVNIPPEKFSKSEGLRDNIGAGYMCIELNRRMGNFARAGEYVSSFHKDLLADEQWIMEFVGFEKELIAAKDSKPYGINELRKKKNPEKK